jgi:hypothetical protein
MDSIELVGKGEFGGDVIPLKLMCREKAREVPTRDLRSANDAGDGSSAGRLFS